MLIWLLNFLVSIFLESFLVFSFPFFKYKESCGDNRGVFCLLFLAHQNNLCLYFSSMYLYKKYTWIILIHYYIVPLLLYFCLFEGEFNSFTHIVVPTFRTCFYSLTLCFLFVLLFLFLFSPLLSFFTQYLFTHLFSSFIFAFY